MRIDLAGTQYQEQAEIASGQRCINLYAESNKGNSQSPVPFTYYQTPGTLLYSQSGLNRETRGFYRTSIGTAYVVVGPNVYFLAANRSLTLVGTITDRQSQIYMWDNGLCLVIVDGVSGWVVDLTTNEFAQIIDPSFYGADYVVFLDTFFIFNRPGTDQFYISLSTVNFALLSGTAIGTGSISAAGAGYTNGAYLNVPLTGGTGTGATANITVVGNVITFVEIVEPGVNYLVGDILSAADADLGGGGGVGFTYTITSFALAFDPLDIAAKSGSADHIVGLIVLHGELWLVGQLTTEIWVGTGAADFFFQRVQGAFIDHGCAAQYSIANQDVCAFWIMQDKQGVGIVVKGIGYEVEEVSTPRIVDEFTSYVTLSDAIGFCFQQKDHAFYCLVFPQANKSWLYDLKTERWDEWNFMDGDGVLNRIRANCGGFAYGKNLIGDFENGIIWELNPTTRTNVDPDDILSTLPIPRIITFPHLLKNGERINYARFVADISVGTGDPAIDPVLADTLYTIDLRWSDDRGKTFGNKVTQTLGRGGQYLTQPIWWRLGEARDRLFELSWSAPITTDLNGAFIEMTPCEYDGDGE